MHALCAVNWEIRYISYKRTILKVVGKHELSSDD